MGSAKRIVSSVASRRLTAVLMISYAVWVVFLAVWNITSPRAIVAAISRLVPFWLLYGLTLLNLLAALWMLLQPTRHRLALAAPQAGAGAGESTVPSADALPEAARAAGYRLRWLDEQRREAVLYRNRLAPLGTLLFHCALLLLPLAYATSRATRFEGHAWVIEGHSFTGKRAEYSRVKPANAFARRAPKLDLRVETVKATFWGNRLFFTDLRALIVDSKRGRAAWATLPSPMWLGGTRVSIRGYNYTPSYEVLDQDGSVRSASGLNLRLFPPGTEDAFALPGLPHRVHVRLYPDAPNTAARPLNRGFALKRPLFHVAITRGKRLVTHAWLRPGQRLTFEGYRLSLDGLRRGGDILVHHDWGYPILWAALALCLLGTIWRIGFASSRVWLRYAEDGRNHAARAIVRDDAFAIERGKRTLARWAADAEGPHRPDTRKDGGTDAR